MAGVYLKLWFSVFGWTFYKDYEGSVYVKRGNGDRLKRLIKRGRD